MAKGPQHAQRDAQTHPNEMSGTIDRLFRDPKPDWVEPRGPFFFLPENASLADVPGLVRDLCTARPEVCQANRASGQHRRTCVLLIQATDIDGGTARAFDAVAAAREAVATGDTNLLSNILLSSAAIQERSRSAKFKEGPFYGGRMDESDIFGATWRREHPNAPTPKTRYWVIINEYIEPVPVTVQSTWPAIVERSLYVAVRSAEAIALRRLRCLS